MRQSRVPAHPTPPLFLPSVSMFVLCVCPPPPYLHVFGWSVSLAIPNTQASVLRPHAGPLLRLPCRSVLRSWAHLSHSLMGLVLPLPVSVMWIFPNPVPSLCPPLSLSWLSSPVAVSWHLESLYWNFRNLVISFLVLKNLLYNCSYPQL